MSGTRAGEAPFHIGKDVKAGYIYDVREKIFVSKFAGKTDLKKRNGDTVEITRVHTPDPVTTEVLGANEPVMSEISFEYLGMQMKRYSSWFPLYGHVVKTHDDDIFGMTMDSVKRQAAASAETLGIAVINSGTSKFYATGTQRTHVKDYLRAGLLDVQQRYLETNEAPVIEKMQKSTSDWGTESLDDCFITLASHDLANDFRNLNGFVRVENYGTKKRLPNEIGTYNRQRVICSSFMKPLLGGGATLSSPEQADIKNTGGKADVYRIVTFGAEAFDFGGLQGEDAMDIIVHNAKVSDTDKTGNKGHVAWEMWFGGMIKQQKYISRIEVSAKTDSKLAA